MEAVWKRIMVPMLALAILIFDPFIISGDGGEAIVQNDHEEISAASISGETRAKFNDSMLMDIDPPEGPAIKGRYYNISGFLFRDLGVIGVRDDNDRPAGDAWVDLYWLDGTPYYRMEHVRTNGSGYWNHSFFVDAPNSLEGAELKIRFKGEWSDGKGNYNLTYDTREVLSRQELWVDDDGDGSFDEERLNFRDDDGDGSIDEDVNAWITKDPAFRSIPIDIRHEVSLEIHLSDDRIDLWNENLLDVSVKVVDHSSQAPIGSKLLNFWLDDELISNVLAEQDPIGSSSTCDQRIELTSETLAGAHRIKVVMDPEMDPELNQGYIRAEASAEFLVRRQLGVEFDGINPETGALRTYRQEDLWVNGTVFDLIEYNISGVKVPPWKFLMTQDPGAVFHMSLWFGEPTDPFSFWKNQGLTAIPDGRFSFMIDRMTMFVPLGFHRCTLTVSSKGWNDEEPPFPDLSRSVFCEVRAKGEIRIWLDQNKNGVDDSIESGLNVIHWRCFCTQKNPTKWNILRIRGVAIDLSQSTGAIKVGVPGISLKFYWGYGRTWERSMIIQTDPNGRFEMDFLSSYYDPCGPVPIRIVAVPSSHYYDLEPYDNSRGDPVSIIRHTKISLENISGTLGEDLVIRGKLLDEIGKVIPKRDVLIYSNTRYHLDEDGTEPAQSPFKLVGRAVTDEIGAFCVRYRLDPYLIGIPQFYALYPGSNEWPLGPDGPRFIEGDAYHGSVSETFTAEVLCHAVFINVTPLKYLVRNGEARFTGRLVVSADDQPTKMGINGVNVTVGVLQYGNGYQMGTARTFSKDGVDGFFDFKTQ
ncbi:MAG: hypothetical protein ACMUHM_03120, partial [Thermoplasmatota archaeon]